MLGRAAGSKPGEGSPLLYLRIDGQRPLAAPARRLGTLLTDPLLYGGAYSLFELIPNILPHSLYLRGGDAPPGQELPIY